jgi:FAD binding domain/Berberine and berberine like
MNPVTAHPTTELAETGLQGLQARLGEEKIVLPRDVGWDEARQAWNLAVDQQPAAVALPRTADDVIAVVRFARSHGLRVAPQGTGHGAPALGSLERTILLRTVRMRGVDVDPAAGVARVAAGAIWAEVTHAAAEHGLAALAGSSPDVGVVGYTLGGGLSWLGRRYGLAANSVTAIELVTPDGLFVRATEDVEPEVFWAFRGGGGSFGVVTALEFRLYPLRQAYAGTLFWPIEQAPEILAAWREWVDELPDETSSVGRLLQLPPIPGIPEPLRGRSFVVVEVAHTGDEAEGAELVRPLRDLQPELDTIATIPITALQQLHMDPEHPVPGAGDGMLLTDVTPETIAALVATVDGSPLLSAEIRQLGGELGRVRPGAGVLARLDAPFAFFAVGIAMTPELKHAVEASVERVQTALAKWDAGIEYLNFAERRKAPERFFNGSTARLAAVKAAIDPADVIRANHPVA